jgi:hypothetical protein
VLAVGGSPRPIGISPGLKNPQGQIVSGKWPFDPDPKWPNASPSTFPRGYWSSLHYAIAAVADFAQTKGPNNLTWNSSKIYNALNKILPKQQRDIDKEIEELVELMQYRAGVMAEMLAQRSSGVWSYWRGILMFDAWSHPRTSDLVEIAQRVGQFQAMHYKMRFQRPRPSQYSPVLMPVIDPPGHASFPSGHATEAYLLSLCLKEVMPAAASTLAKDRTGKDIPNSSPLDRLAQRVARNREVLGVHFRSDTLAGEKLAELSFSIMKESKMIKQIMAEAKAEWQ